MVDLVSGFGGAIVDVVAPETGEPYAQSSALRAGYIAFLQVVAAEWRPPRDTDDRDDLRGLTAFADVRANDAVLEVARRRDARWPAIRWWSRPCCTGWRRPSLGQRMADPAVYRPFLEARPPRDVHPALLLGAFRNFQAKLLSAWSRARAAGHPPHDLVDLVEAYADAYPAERAEATRIFLVTTYAATALPDGVRADEPPDAGRIAAGDADRRRAVRPPRAARRLSIAAPRRARVRLLFGDARAASARRARRPGVRRKQPRVWSLTSPAACMNA